LLAVLCLVLGLIPGYTIHFIINAVSVWTHSPVSAVEITRAAPLGWISFFGIILITGFIFLRLAGYFLFKNKKIALTWDCGYAGPNSRIQYTGTSFVNPLLRLFKILMRYKLTHIMTDSLFPGIQQFFLQPAELLLESVFYPVKKAVFKNLKAFNFIQHGLAQSYVMFIILITLILFFLTGRWL